ncbi:MAG: glycine betaine ABC transporter substrate-binding protein [Spirochaeta sp.]|jgi:glycine betaine/proline transport system substrate-binding protein|nr:glycine betaine ABC transporter substrate-binding protein [Spirochaeta sp.]
MNAVYRSVMLALLAGVVVAGCTRGEEQVDPEVLARREARSEQTIRLVYPEWSSETASAHLIQAVLQERLGYRVDLISVDAEAMWSRVASGDADMLAGAWLPVTHREYLRQYGDEVEDLGPNLEGARIGLVVPTMRPGRQTDATGRTGRDLVSITAIPEMAERADEFRGRIIGIESGAGVVARTREALDVYDLDRQFHLVESDEAHMVDRVNEAISRDEWVVFTGWRPHWMFERHNLRFLNDPDGVYGGEEAVHTMVCTRFGDAYPDAYEVLDRMQWSLEDLERLMRWIQEDDARDAYGQALRWIDVHAEIVDEWVVGIE